jgi:hypothetical protein
MTAAHAMQIGGVTVWSMRAVMVTSCSQVAHLYSYLGTVFTCQDS